MYAHGAGWRLKIDCFVSFDDHAAIPVLEMVSDNHDLLPGYQATGQILFSVEK
ncbi:hypothetical protein NBRC3257_1125 [Gluconobacter thailandicus NBRC 3257]|uniref:Uncharacterized protein n=1 Tax=Gluconobacter thailandicus NBRC 3257 TaxID=1381097 RepID=A0ABQ0IV86_GLUTH|nr:hypothetical protein B932_1329 [Gluconobacter oxydans H24]GAC86565.1 hypothetical protein NBRC3255_0226 [Gluconobacter thailandicus NBRC 3255]GAD26126.1 hypothetical protein NBRC3257_1125 [Gluconobacter thailandicus NBRC 3257]